MKVQSILYYMLYLLIISSVVYCEINNDSKEQITELLCTYTRSLLADSQVDVDSFNTTEWCPDEVDTINGKTRSKHELEELINQINRTFIEHRKMVNILLSRVSKTAVNITVGSLQNFKSIEIVGDANFLVVSEDKLDDVEDVLSLSTETDSEWSYLQIVDYANQTKELWERVEVNRQLSEQQVVWANVSESIQGSCCMLANISLETGRQIIVDDLIIKKDSDDVYLDGDVTWGFISLDDVDRDISGVVTFEKTIKANTLETPSIDLRDAFLLDHEPMVLRGNLSFIELESNLVSIDSVQHDRYNLETFVPINSSSTLNLCCFNFDEISTTKIEDVVISSVNLTNLLDFDQNQTLYSPVSVKKIELNGPSLSERDDFVPKLVEKLVEFVNKTDSLTFNKLVISSINVSNFYTQDWNNWMFIDTDEKIDLDQVTINGSVNFIEKINDIEWNDLVSTEDFNSTEKIEANLIFEDQILISEDLAYELFKTNITPGNWKVQSDLIITKELNDILLDDFHQNLIPLNGSIDEIEFEESIFISNCNFKRVNDTETANIANYREMNYSSTFDVLVVDQLVLDGCNIESCLQRNGLYNDSTADYPIDYLDIESLQLNGTINEIDPAFFMVNCSNQDFRTINGSLLTSDIDFKTIEMDSVGPANVNTDELNGLKLNRLLRDDPKLKWPDTVILKDCNITSLNNPWLERLRSSMLSNNRDQTIFVPLEFIERVLFAQHVLYSGIGPSVRINYGTEGNLVLPTLEIKGNLIIFDCCHKISNETDLKLEQGMEAKKIIVNNLIAADQSIIYSNSTWYVHKKSSKFERKASTFVEDLVIHGNLEIIDEKTVPWISQDSFNGVQFYPEVKLVNFTVNIPGNVTFNKLNSLNNTEIKLDEIELINQWQNPLKITQGLTFDGNTTIYGDVIVDKNIEISSYPQDNYSFDFGNSSSATFTDEVMIVADFN